MRLPASGMDMEQFYNVLVHLAKNEVVAILLNRLSDNSHTYKRNSEYICTRFFDVLTRYYSSERSVSFYASELCISNKYLATVVKAVSGKTPADMDKRAGCRGDRASASIFTVYGKGNRVPVQLSQRISFG